MPNKNLSEEAQWFLRNLQKLQDDFAESVGAQIVGSITGCGGRYDRGESKEELREKYSKLTDELGIEDKEDFLKAGVDEIEPVTEEEMKKRAERLAKLVGILAEETALGEVFGIEE